MLDAGFSTIAYLRSRLLPQARASDTTWDDALKRIGLSVAKRMQSHCSRKFDRETTRDEFSARALCVTLKSYPIEEIESIELRGFTGEFDEISVRYQLDKSAGIIDFINPPGSITDRVVITYTGGFWLDPMDGTEIPDGATALPEDLMEAWLTQIQLEAQERNVFEAMALKTPRKEGENKPVIAGLKLHEDVQDVLRPYRRFAGE